MLINKHQETIRRKTRDILYEKLFKLKVLKIIRNLTIILYAFSAHKFMIITYFSQKKKKHKLSYKRR